MVAPTISRLAGAHDVVPRLQSLLDRSAIVPTVDLVEIDVVGAEPLQAGIDLMEDRLARQTGTVWPGAHAAVDLGTRREPASSPRGIGGDCPMLRKLREALERRQPAAEADPPALVPTVCTNAPGAPGIGPRLAYWLEPGIHRAAPTIPGFPVLVIEARQVL